METVARPLQRVQGTGPDQATLPDSSHIGARLLDQAARYVQVLDLPDDVAALKRLYGELATNQVKLLQLLDRLAERLDRLERRR
jgi:hypothetical protein